MQNSCYTELIFFSCTPRANSSEAYILEEFDQESVNGSNFDVSKPTFFLVHGFASSAYTDWVQNAKEGKIEENKLFIQLLFSYHQLRFPKDSNIENGYLKKMT